MSRPSPVRLCVAPTPLDAAPRLSEALGLELLVKRDDLTGLALGGNKARKLEHLVADAIARGCDVLVTSGGAQSNFARMTAGAAAKLGFGCHLVLAGDAPSAYSGNLILDDLFGATIEFAGAHDWRVLEARVHEIAAQIGPRAYPMPIGGASAVGALGYVDAADELMSQCETPPDWIVLADGSGGTHAGLLVGLPPQVRVLGIDVARPPRPHVERIPELARDTAELCGRSAPGGPVHIVDHTGPHYAAITDECRAALRLAARTEGLVLDPVYSGKALAGLVAAAKEGRIAGRVVFLHTGGAPALFATDYRMA